MSTPAIEAACAAPQRSTVYGRLVGLSWLRGLETPQFRLTLALAVCFVAVAAAFSGERDALALRQHLGGEYYNIARALADGRGFSDPFGERTGPTAWMPPLLPGLMALILILTNSRVIVATTVFVMSVGCWAWGGGVVYSVARRYGQRISPLLAVAFYVLWVCAFNYWTLRMTHDVWLVAAGTVLLTSATCGVLAKRRVSPWGWGLLGGFFSLASPALALGWACIVVLAIIGGIGKRRTWCLAIFIAVAMALPWTIRNGVVFHQLIPTKANFFYDAYQANYTPGEGVWNIHTTIDHPLGSSAARFTYASMGETAFLAHYKQMFLDAATKDPAAILHRARYRAMAALFRYPPWSDDSGSPGSVLRRCIYPVPIVVLLAACWIPGPNRRVLLALAALEGAYLSPYIALAFYARYLMPLSPLLAVIVFLGLDQVAHFASRVRDAGRNRKHGVVKEQVPAAPARTG